MEFGFPNSINPLILTNRNEDPDRVFAMVKQVQLDFMKATLSKKMLSICLVLLCQIFLTCERKNQMMPPNDEIKASSKLYVANSGSNTISVIDADSDEVIQTIVVGQQPSAMTFSSPRKQLYISNFLSKNISSVDVLTDMKIDDFEAGGVPLKMDIYLQNRLLVLIQRDTINYWDRPIIVMDLDTKAKIDTLELSNPCAYLNAFAIVSDGKLFGTGFHGPFCDFIPTTPLIYGLTERRILGYMTLAGTELVLSSDEKLICIVGQLHSNFVFDIKRSRYAKVGGIPSLGGYDSLKHAAFSVAKQKIYISEPMTRSLLIVNSSSYAIEDTIVLGFTPASLVVSMDERKLYISAPNENQVTVFDLETKKVAKLIPVGQEPKDMVAVNL